MFSCLLWNTAVAALMACTLILLGRWCRLTPATRHAFWLVILVKLLSPIGLIWSVPLPFAPPIDLALEPAPDESRLLADASSVAVTIGGEGEATAFPSATQLFLAANQTANFDPNSQPSPTRSAIRIISIWLLLAWVAGSVVVAWRYFVQTIRFARHACGGKLAGGWLTRQVAELAGNMGVRVPEVRIVSGLPSPVVWCLFRPVLLWPKGLQNHLNSGGREAVLVHELAHLRRRDHLWRWLEMLAAVVHWWNPLFWLARREMRYHAELACDAWVLGTLPNHRRDYAEALLDVCQRSARPAAPTPAVGVGGEGKKMLERRLSMIMRETVPYRVATGAKLFVVLLAMAALPAWTLGQPKPEPKREEKLTPIKIESSQLELRFAADEKVEKKVQEELLKAINLEMEALLVAEEKGKDNPDAKAKEIEAKIKELTIQLERLKAVKAEREKAKQSLKEVEGPIGMILKSVDAKEQKIIVFGPDGKELHGLKVLVSPNEAPKPEPKKESTDPKGLRFRIVEGQSGKILIEMDKPAVALPPVKVNPIQIKVRPPEVKADTVKPGEVVRFIFGAPATNSITLTRTTYKLPKEKAAALEAFLKEHVKAKVLETKLEGDGLTVTTTPETQKAIESVVNLIRERHTATLKIAEPQIRFIAPEKKP